MVPAASAENGTVNYDSEKGILSVVNYSGSAPTLIDAEKPFSGSVLVEQTNAVTGTVRIGKAALILLPGSSLTIDSISGDSLLIVTGMDSQLVVSEDLDLEQLYVAGPGTVKIDTMSVSGTAVLQQTGVVEVTESATAGNLFVPTENGIFLSADAQSPADAYVAGQYLRVEPYAQIETVYLWEKTDAETGETVTTVAFPYPEGAYLLPKGFLAGYDSQGRMMTVVQGSCKYGVWTFSVDPVAADCWKAFFLNGDTAPACAAYTVLMNEKEPKTAVGSVAAAAAETDYTPEAELAKLLGYMNGYEDGLFHPERILRRQEAAKIVCLFANAGDDVSELYAKACSVEDVDQTSWSAAYISYCIYTGIASHMVENNCFDPTGEGSICDAAGMLLAVIGYASGTMNFRDADTVLREAMAVGLFDGFPAKTDPMASCTRGQLAQMIANALRVKCVTGILGSLDTVAEKLPGKASEFLADETALQFVSIIWNNRYELRLDRFGNLVVMDETPLYMALYQGHLTYVEGNDVWGRPGQIWTWSNNKGNQIGQVIKVTAELLQKSTQAVNVPQVLQLQLGQGGYTCQVYVDGQQMMNEALTLSVAEAISDFTGCGVQTEIYVDADSKTVTVVVINTYLAQVLRIEAGTETQKTKYYLGQADGTELCYVTGNKKYQLNDWLLFNRYGNQWRNFVVIEKQTAVISETGASVVKLGDRVYPYAANYGQLLVPDARKAVAEDIGTEVTYALDPYGNVLYLDLPSQEEPAEPESMVGVFLPGSGKQYVDSIRPEISPESDNCAYDIMHFDGETEAERNVDKTLYDHASNGNLLIRYTLQNGVACWEENAATGTITLLQDGVAEINGIFLEEETKIIAAYQDPMVPDGTYVFGVIEVEQLTSDLLPAKVQYFLSPDHRLSYVLVIFEA